jgi:hypothetical protein
MHEEARKIEQAVRPLPPMVVTLTRKGDALHVDGRQAGLKDVTPKVLDLLLEWDILESRLRGKLMRLQEEERRKAPEKAFPPKEFKDELRKEPSSAGEGRRISSAGATSAGRTSGTASARSGRRRTCRSAESS